MINLFRKIRVAIINSPLPEPYNSYGDHWVDGFEDAGCQVEVFSYDKIQWLPLNYDLYFFVEIRYNPAQIPWYINPRVLYSWDSHVTGIQMYIDNIGRFFEKILLASKIDVEALKSHGITHAEWIPEACNPRIHKNRHQERTIPLGFVGNLNTSIVRNGYCKTDFVNHLKPYHKTCVFGNAYNEVQNQIKVMFDRTIGHNIGTRIFESSAAGCVPMWSKAGYANGIEELLIENVHYVPYDDTIEGFEKIYNELIKDEARMKSITTAAEKHVLANHTYAHRARQILEFVGIKPIEVNVHNENPCIR